MVTRTFIRERDHEQRRRGKPVPTRIERRPARQSVRRILGADREDLERGYRRTGGIAAPDQRYDDHKDIPGGIAVGFGFEQSTPVSPHLHQGAKTMSNDGDSKLSRYELRENQLNIVSGGSPLQQVVQLWNVGAAAAPEPRT